jgi:hypothetical protein
MQLLRVDSVSNLKLKALFAMGLDAVPSHMLFADDTLMMIDDGLTCVRSIYIPAAVDEVRHTGSVHAVHLALPTNVRKAISRYSYCD